MVECRMKIEVWNENAPAPDTLVSEYFVPLEDICGVQEEEFDFKVDLFRRRKKKAFQFANRFFGRGKQTNESTGAGEADETPDGGNAVEPSNSVDGDLAESLHLPGGHFYCKVMTEIDLGIEGADAEIVIQAVNMTANGLPETEVGFLAGKQDPYVIMKLAGSKAQSSYINGGGTDVAWEKEELVLQDRWRICAMNLW